MVYAYNTASKDEEGMANSVDLDQTAPIESSGQTAPMGAVRSDCSYRSRQVRLLLQESSGQTATIGAVRSDCSYRVIRSDCSYRVVWSDCSYRVVRSDCFYRIVRSDCSYRVVRSDCSYRSRGLHCLLVPFCPNT